MMKKKQTKHFVPDKDNIGSGTPACNCFQDLPGWPDLSAHTAWGEVAKTKRGVTCKNCRRTRIFRKLI